MTRQQTKHTASSQTYDIVLLPDAELAAKGIQLSEQLGQTYDTRFTLNDQSEFPHYSIYMAQLDENGVAEAKQRLQQIANAFSIFDLEATHYWQDKTDGMFEVQYKRTPQLITLQEQVLQAINPLRKGRFLRKYPSGATKEALETHLSGNALQQLRIYAYPEIGEDYRPHMTFTRLSQNTLAETITTENLAGANIFSGAYPFLGLYLMGENGTCTQEVALFDLYAPRENRK